MVDKNSYVTVRANASSSECFRTVDGAVVGMKRGEVCASRLAANCGLSFRWLRRPGYQNDFLPGSTPVFYVDAYGSRLLMTRERPWGHVMHEDAQTCTKHRLVDPGPEADRTNPPLRHCFSATESVLSSESSGAASNCISTMALAQSD